MLCAVALATVFASSTAIPTNRTVVVTGATGRTGVLVYKALQAQGMTVRAIVRNVTKARERLGCTACNASDGIFIGDLADSASLAPAMVGAHALVSTVGCTQVCIAPFVCHFLPGEHPKEILFDGLKTQVEAFVNASGPPLHERQIMLMSMLNTEKPPSWWFDIVAKLWGGFDVGFFSLNGEAFLMASGVKFTILKACGLSDEPASQKRLIASHDGQGIDLKNQVSRADVARVLAEAVATPALSEGLRFDFCAAADGPAQADAADVLRDAMYPFDPRKLARDARTSE